MSLDACSGMQFFDKPYQLYAACLKVPLHVYQYLDPIETGSHSAESIQVHRALLESAASEHGARMAAMDAAARNAGEMIGALTLTYNKARQAHITKELIEIVNGAEALKG